MSHILNCPRCGAHARLRSAELVWPGRGLPSLYLCDNYPSCDTYVRCHPGTIEPMGTLAGPRLRKLRGIAHELFDPLWQNCGILGRSSAYRAAAEVMRCEGEFHIGHLDEVGCTSFIERIDEVRQRYEEMQQRNERMLEQPDEVTVDILLGLFNPQETEFFRQVCAASLDRYPDPRDQALAHGWISPIQEEGRVQAYVLTAIGSIKLYSQSE